MAQRDRLPIQVDELLWQLQEDMRAGDLEAIRDRQAEIDSLSERLALETFDRRAVNRRLKQYAMNDAAWMCQSGLEVQSEAAMRIRPAVGTSSTRRTKTSRRGAL